MSGGFLEFSRADIDALEGLHRELRRIGVNVNQVVHAANRGRVDLVRGHWEALAELRRALPGVRNLPLQIIANGGGVAEIEIACRSAFNRDP